MTFEQLFNDRFFNLSELSRKIFKDRQGNKIRLKIGKIGGADITEKDKGLISDYLKENYGITVEENKSNGPN